MSKQTNKTKATHLLTLREVCATCGVSISTGRRWVHQGLLPVVVLPEQNMRFRPADVQDFIDEHCEDRRASCPA